MLLVLLSWAYIFMTSTLAGYALLSFIKGKNHNKEVILSFPIVSFLGIVFINIFSLSFSLVAPVSVFAHLFLWILIALYYALNSGSLSLSIGSVRNSFTKDFLHGNSYLLISAAILLAIAVISSHGVIKPQSVDSNLYHIQATKWLKNFGTVPGLALVHSRLAFNSTAFSLNAFYNYSFLHPAGNFFSVNGYLFLICSFSFLRNIIRGFRKENYMLIFFWGAVISVAWYYFMGIKDWISSPAPDLTLACAGWMLLLTVEEYKQSEKLLVRKVFCIIICMFIAFLMTVKLSLAPYVLFIFLFPFQLIKSLEGIDYAKIMGLCLFVSIPFFLCNVILSGYLLFPFTIPDIFNMEWEFPERRTKVIQGVIKAWAKARSNVDPGAFAEWVPKWFDMAHNPIVFKAFLLALISPAFILLNQVFGRIFRSIKLLDAFWIKFYAIIYLSLIFWFVNAPDFRFIIVSISILVGLAISQFLSFLNIIGGSKLISKVFIISVFSLLVSRMVMPSSFIEPQSFTDDDFEIFEMNGIPFVRPGYGGPGCMDYPLPCTTDRLLINTIEMRGDNYGNGFRNKN